MTKKLVSVVMGVHNEPEEYLRLAVKSICQQTYSNIEIIIIDDCSDTVCRSLLSRISEEDSRITIIRNETNLGLTKSLNVGLSVAQGEYIARMDADDYSLPNRFEKQVLYFEQHPDIDLLGTGVVTFGDSVCYFSPYKGYTKEQSKCELFFSSTLCHPSVMMRHSFLLDNDLLYDPNVRKGQDYDMWERCSVYGNMCVLPEVLLLYRVHKNQITSTNRTDQDNTLLMVMRRRLTRLGVDFNEREFHIHQLLASGTDKTVSVSEVEAWISKLEASNLQSNIAPILQFHSNLTSRLFMFKVRNMRFQSMTFSDCINLIRMLFNRMTIKMSASLINKKYSL